MLKLTSRPLMWEWFLSGNVHIDEFGANNIGCGFGFCIAAEPAAGGGEIDGWEPEAGIGRDRRR
jgi:hypothetical protein